MPTRKESIDFIGQHITALERMIKDARVKYKQQNFREVQIVAENIESEGRTLMMEIEDMNDSEEEK